MPAWCVCKGRRPPVFLSAATGPGSGPPLPLARIQRGSRFPRPSHLPAPAPGALEMGAPRLPDTRVRSPGLSRPAGPGELRQPPPSAPSSLRSSFPPFPPERRVRAGVGGDFARVSISYLAAKLSFCVSPSRSLQLLLSSEMPGQGKGLRAGWLRGGLGDGTGSVRAGSCGRGGAGGGALVVPCPALCLCKAWGRSRPGSR